MDGDNYHFLSRCFIFSTDSQLIISQGWPGLISIRLEVCHGVHFFGKSQPPFMRARLSLYIISIDLIERLSDILIVILTLS